jgi:hypothetical protein
LLTLTEAPAELDPATLRYTALFGIAMGFTAAELRTRSAGTSWESADKQLADEIELMTACGFTRRVSSTVLAERDRANRALRQHRYSAEDMRRGIRTVAEAGLRQEGPEAVRMFRQLADTAEQEGDIASRRSFLEFAAAAELLLAEYGAESFA